MTVLVTGGAGFLGQHVCRALRRSHPAVVFVPRSANYDLRDSDAVLAIWRGLGWPWRALGVFGLVPRGLRDGAYRWVARNRYRLFGRRETCWVPSPEQRERLL